MSFTDGEQPPEGQDAQGQGDRQPYADYLERIPEQLRGDVEPVFKDWDAQVTRKFQDASEFRKTWEPYQETGITQYQPEEVQWMSQFRGALDNPQAIQEWYQAYAEQNGLAQNNQPEETPFGELDGLDDSTAQLFRQQLEQSMGPINQELQALKQWRDEQQTQAQQQKAQEQIESQMGKLEKDHPDEFNRGMVEKLVAQYIQTDPKNAVNRAFADWQQIRNEVSASTLQSKVGLPPSPEMGGRPDGSPPEVRTMKDANQYALARIREANRQG